MSQSTNTPHFSENRILESLPADEYQRLLPHMEDVRLKAGDVISNPDEKIEHVYFPKRGTISVCAVLKDGAQVEVGVIGNEGMFGLPVLFGTNTTPLKAMVQIPDGAVRINAELFNREIEQCRQLDKLLLHYAQAFFLQIAQSAACNSQHCIDERLARWLLMCHDRTRSDLLELTQEFVSIMLGVRRASVTEAATKLRNNGLIDYQRGVIRILDRKGLEASSCECYEVVRREFDRLLI